MGKSPWVGASGNVRLTSDGRASIPTVSGELLYFDPAPPISAVHGNPGFEAQTAGTPDVWDFFWKSGTTTVASETATVYSGDRSLKVTIASGGGFQVVLSNTFDVAGGDRVDFSTFGVKDVGTPKIQLGLLTGASGTPVFLDANYTNNENSPAAVSTTWQRHSRSAIVPGGHTKARLFFRVTPTTTEAVTVYLDLTASAVTAAGVKDSGWLALPFAANWTDAAVAGWREVDYRRLGDDLYLRGLSKRTTSASGALSVIGTLPVEFRPTATERIADVYWPAAGGTSPDVVYVNAAGEIVTSASVPANDYVPLWAGPISLL